MNIRRALGMALGLALALGIFIRAAHAGKQDQATRITFSEPVQVPGCLLPAGTYWFALNNTGAADRQTVQISSSDWSKTYATVTTEPVQRKSWRGRSSWDARGQIVLAKGTNGQPDSLVSWFYPGRVTGHHFIYPTRTEKQLQQEARVTVDLTRSGRMAG